MENYYLFTFESTHAAIATEKLLKPAGAIVMPVPRYISSSCGISIRVNPENKEQAEELFRENSKLKPYINDDLDYDYNYYYIQIDQNDVKVDRLEI